MIEALPLKVMYHLALVTAVAAHVFLRRADRFGFGGAEWVHRTLGASFGVALVITALAFGMHLYEKHGVKLAAVTSPLFIAIAALGLFILARVALCGRDKARAFLSSLSKRGF